jgi:hypothetical protein
MTAPSRAPRPASRRSCGRPASGSSCSSKERSAAPGRGVFIAVQSAGKRLYPLVKELAANGIPVAVTCLVLKLARQPYYRWLADPITDAEYVAAHRANALFDAHRDDPEFGYRFLVEEARDAGHPMAERTAWRICSDNTWWSAFGKRRRGKNGKVGPPVHDDLVGRRFTADAPNWLWPDEAPWSRIHNHVSAVRYRRGYRNPQCRCAKSAQWVHTAARAAQQVT